MGVSKQQTKKNIMCGVVWCGGNGVGVDVVFDDDMICYLSNKHKGGGVIKTKLYFIPFYRI